MIIFDVWATFDSSAAQQGGLLRVLGQAFTLQEFRQHLSEAAELFGLTFRRIYLFRDIRLASSSSGRAEFPQLFLPTVNSEETLSMPAIRVPIFWLNWLNDLLKLNSFLVLEHKVRHELGPLAPPEAMQPVLAELRRALDTNKLDAVRIVLLKALGREDEAQEISDFMARRTSANNSHL